MNPDIRNSWLKVIAVVGEVSTEPEDSNNMLQNIRHSCNYSSSSRLFPLASMVMFIFLYKTKKEQSNISYHFNQNAIEHPSRIINTTLLTILYRTTIDSKFQSLLNSFLCVPVQFRFECAMRSYEASVRPSLPPHCQATTLTED